MATPTITVTPKGGALGAEVRGIDLSTPADADITRVLELLREHLVLFFPDQHLDDDAHLAFALRLGTPYVHPIGRVLGRTDASVEHIVDDADHPPFQDGWHTDVSWDPEPPVFGTLRAIELPPAGGDTIWSSMYAAYDALSPAMQTMLEGLEAHHDMGAGAAFVSKAGAEVAARTREAFPGATHPVVRVQPDTGRRYLYVNAGFTRGLVGFADDESAVLLRMLFRHAQRPNFQVRHSWTFGEVAVWDERVTQHFAVADHFPNRREMGRVPVRIAS